MDKDTFQINTLPNLWGGKVSSRRFSRDFIQQDLKCACHENNISMLKTKINNESFSLYKI